LEIIRKNLLTIVVGVAVLLAWFAPHAGKAISSSLFVSWLIALTFVCQGAGIAAHRFRSIRAYGALLVWGSALSLVVAPVLGWLLAKTLGWPRDLEIGFLLMCCMGPTLVSGIVIAAQSGGEREAATLLTICVNLLSVLAIPIGLSLSIGAGQSIDRVSLLTKLVLVVLLPALAGQALRWRFPSSIARLEGAIAVIPVLLLGAIIYLSLAQHAESLSEVRFAELALIALPALCVHYSLMALGYGGARGLFSSSRARATSLAVVASQKTLPVAIAVWTHEFARSHPLALLPPIVFHLSQVYGDSILAGPWSRRLQARAANPVQ
jgi:predicted Na+-dependent transporter